MDKRTFVKVGLAVITTFALIAILGALVMTTGCTGMMRGEGMMDGMMGWMMAGMTLGLFLLLALIVLVIALVVYVIRRI